MTWWTVEEDWPEIRDLKRSVLDLFGEVAITRFAACRLRGRCLHSDHCPCKGAGYYKDGVCAASELIPGD